jgi:hypothetical protein
MVANTTENVVVRSSFIQVSCKGLDHNLTKSGCCTSILSSLKCAIKDIEAYFSMYLSSVSIVREGAGKGLSRL